MVKIIKKSNLIRITMILFLVLLLNTISYAVVVSDNDGSAFITKAEFDSLKNDFQATIDQYNTGIDNKIDEAIASYLAGIKVSKKETLPTLYAPTEGVLSLNASDFPWQEGRMDMKFYGGVFRYSGNQVGYFEFSLSTSNPTNFRETLISNVDYTYGTGSFVGYYKTKQYFVSNGNNSKNYGYRQYGMTQVTGYNGGYFPVSNQVLTTYGQLYTIGFYNNTWATDYYGTNVLECHGKNASFRRELVTTNPSENWTGGLILNANSLSHKFNNNDEYRDWCNDSTTDGHTVTQSMDSVGLSGTGQRVDITPNGNTAMNVETGTPTILTSGNISAGAAIGTQYAPYLGFVSTADDWNKIYVDSFDAKMNAVLLSTDPNYSKNIINNSKGQHLKLGAGLPIVECKKGYKVTYEFHFKDTTQDYRVWVKEGSFDSSKNLSVDKNDCVDEFKVSGTTTYDSTNKCLVIKNGNGKATWEIKSDKTVVYIKWANSGSVNAGGGILLPSSTVDIEKE